MIGVLGRCLAAAMLLLLIQPVMPALAVQPDEVLADPVLEGRARDISQHLRCVVCQNQSIDDSNADIARDFRLLVRERLVAGDSDQQVLNFFVARYGDYILLKPRFRLGTTPLWLGPPLIIVLAMFGIFLWFRSNRQAVRAEVEPLSAAERERLDALVLEMTGPNDAAADGAGPTLPEDTRA